MADETILVVDDSEIVTAMAREALEEGGYKIITASGAKAADKFIFSENKPDLIILDVMLPVLDGDKKARMLKDNELVRHIPILLLSSKSEDVLRQLVQESGADGYVRKPFVNRQLVEMVKQTIARSKAAV